MSKYIINAADAPTSTARHGEFFERSMTELAGELGARAIGANITRVPPGKAAFPFHHHSANEEHFFILSGSGVLRLGSETHALRPHDYIVNPPGGPDRAHQLINTGTEDLVYLAISTQILPEVVGYPDSRKTGVRTGLANDIDSRFLVDHEARRPRNEEEYWRGEDGSEVARRVPQRT